MSLVEVSISFIFSFVFSIYEKTNQKNLGLFLCLWKLQKRFLHAKQTVSLVLCSIFLSSPLFCFPNSIKSRPFSLYLFVVFVKIWIVNFEILNIKSGHWVFCRQTECIEMTCLKVWLRYNFSKEKSLSHQFTISPKTHYTTILLHHCTNPPLTATYSPLTTHCYGLTSIAHQSTKTHYTTTLLHHYTNSPLTATYSPLKTLDSRLTTHQSPLHHYTNLKLTSNSSIRLNRVLDTNFTFFKSQIHSNWHKQKKIELSILKF